MIFVILRRTSYYEKYVNHVTIETISCFHSCVITNDIGQEYYLVL